MVNTPIPHSLKSEAKKAAKILREFTMPNAKTGPDKLIPAGIFAKAKGLAIITVFKAGFLVTARGGSGIVIAKVKDSLDFASGWSAPSAIGLAALGGGFEIGMEVTDFVILLNSTAAVEAFSKGGNLTLGGNFTIAAGPLGRNVEGDIAVRGSAAIYTYSKTKGIFAGISVEGSALIERKDANKKFYGEGIRAHQILRGDVEIPEECQPLYQVMRDHQEEAAKAILKMAKNRVKHEVSKSKSQSEWNLSSLKSFSVKPSKKSSSPKSPPKPKPHSPTRNQRSSIKTTPKPSVKRSSFSSYSSYTRQRRDSEPSAITKGHGITSMSATSSASTYAFAAHDPWADIDAGSNSDSDSDGLWVVADYPFQGQLSCDLSFQTGDKLLVTWKSNCQDDWWEGLTRTGQQGIFPANYCHILHA